ncbi:MAG: hypothetical protein ACM3US_01725 [Sphingomonadaceae bacterium]
MSSKVTPPKRATIALAAAVAILGLVAIGCGTGSAPPGPTAAPTTAEDASSQPGFGIHLPWRPVAEPTADAIAVPPLPPEATATSATIPDSVAATPAAGIESLTVEEYPVATQGEATPDRIEYRRRIAPEILEKRRAWRGGGMEQRLPGINQTLATFGYRILGNERSDYSVPLYNLLQGDTVLLRDISMVWPISVNESGDDFALVLETRQGGQQLVLRGGVQQWDAMRHAGTQPVFVGNDLVSVEMDPQRGERYAVLRNGEVVHRFEAQFIVDNPIKGLWSWDGHWVLEVDGEVVVDGESLNQQLGYDEIFGWRLLAGWPLYFFKKGDRIGLSYAGQILPHQYQEVIHYRCCEPAAFNLAGNDTMVWFHALKDGVWHYVEAGVYE